ncbi:CaiB/BaiF CoA transferase family protein [Dermatobacter hominis]|uniref:CaiB/BaiF CoA transferase family protein n=1 Tax=Dermatobacter hominis TaxID=2884263 RepID=UPI001D11426A|nr:CoA transferase [Dermatobacter hominis]UDY37983.1 CoA transferase [Dermatobacter hominis]
MPGALSDLRVVEMGQLLAGPFCGQLLADFGADVIKLEPPGQGDPMREWGREKADGRSLWWPVVARGKRSVTIDLRQKAGQDLAKELIASADVLIENFRPGTLEKWSMPPEELMAANPRLIVVRVSGYGQTGPYASRPGYGAIGEAMGGLRAVIGEPDRPPARAGISIGDTLAATFACLGCLVALHARQATGRGQIVDSALYEAVLGVMESLIPEYTVSDYIRPRTGSILPNVAPANAYPTADGEHLISGNQDTVWKRLAAAMGRPELGDDERYATHNARGANQAELDALIAEWSATMTSRELEDLLNEHGVPNGKIYTAPDMLADAHFKAREAIVTLAHPQLGDFPMQNVVPKLSDTPGEIRWVGPELGEHTDEVLGDVLGLDGEALDRLRADGTI